MKITLLGTGDAAGTPKIGCNCKTCQDALQGGRSSRLRSATLIETTKGKVLIDTGPDLRKQLLRENISHIDACIWTHGHYDHYAGYPEFYRVQKHVPVYGITTTLDYILSYLHFLHPERNDVKLYEPFELAGAIFTLFKVIHPPQKDCAGVLIEQNHKKIVITGDTGPAIPEQSIELMMEADLLIADAITPPHIKLVKHMNAEEAFELYRKTGARKVIFTHISHLYKPHDEAIETWPLGYDGMEIII
ncbi:MAG: phosphoribosyl 1,2-cyclic phosphate phosphodiesterase [Candidatus Argoarchaeum ethanivorans]|uniref:Phosphoribosyl 1,2-cyclic phosphate phosphodiesterase n=1 Tax=Candidatus Argoarchaeum ethanivorans TaxID=2608793 RepID=A0A8B3S2I6_9EURY|nr:MAG: phosphoribosyl 1,2-cyclic phosphate phosphodiesterase [Candidatus Argoarchaeum ethanivorans]